MTRLFGINPYRNKSDIELIAQYQTGLKPDPVGELFKRYSAMIYSICYKYFRDSDLSKDASMDIFEVLLEKLKTHQVSNFKSWLHTLVRNHCLMQLRASKTEYEFDDRLKNDTGVFMEDDSGSHQEIVEKENKLVALELCITRLNDEQRVCVELFYLEQKSYTEISSVTGFDLKKVKSYIQNGKRNLKIMMDNYHD
ncbi:MAG TPA: sigma-70 family RNA polymerase sigma factor [Bacteroidales bacterium]|nr:sigma-70 family RNA polymerase sigma factor [Bacteroidales bacterium]HOE04771.1 sigma-70 family RNA polymerase sigma factor [Bacteroidales bacterium]HQL69988.1 sigma-70 family RNA polymerase sigma factor [Bacteroidales bacterium]